jgi:hypothetical protein
MVCAPNELWNLFSVLRLLEEVEGFIASVMKVRGWEGNCFIAKDMYF